jgi:hypothetical protein
MRDYMDKSVEMPFVLCPLRKEAFEGVLEYWSNGIMEYWSGGVMA